MKRSSPRLVLGLTLATFTGCLISPGSSVAGGLTDVAGLLVGYNTSLGKVPIVPTAVLYDLGVGGKPQIRPGADCGYAAAKAAGSGPVAEGNVGAGSGATVGKLGGAGGSMKAGIGTASITLPSGLVVAAMMASPVPSHPRIFPAMAT